MESVECGAAALGIVLAYHGRHVPLEELRVRCGVSRDGSKASNILKAARSYGLEATGWKLDTAQLRQRKTPFIVFWRFSHFLVVEGMGRRWVHVNDPASGPRRVSAGEFGEGYTGVALMFAKGADFLPGGSRPGFFRSLLPRLAGSGAGLLYIILAGLALAASTILSPLYTQLFIDGYLIQGLSGWVPPLLGAMAATAAIAAALSWLELSHLLRLQVKLSVTSSSRFFWHVLRLPISFYSQRYAGEIGSRVALNDTVASILSGELATTAITLVTMVFNLAMLGAYTWKLTLIGVAVGALNLAVLGLVSRKRVDGNTRLLQETGKLTGVTMAGLQMMETIKASGMEDSFFARFGGHHAAVIGAGQSLGAASQALNAAPVLLGQLNGMVMLCWGAWLAMGGELSEGMLAAFLALMAAFIAPFGTLVNLGGSIQDAQGTMSRLDDVLKAPLDPSLVDAENRGSGGEQVAAGRAAPKLEGRLELKNVSFGYSALEEPFIRDFSMKLEPGQRVALVGGSGSGKTTIANLVCGLYDPWQGEILFDGAPRSRIPRETLVSSVSRVSQDIHLFEGSCGENIAMWDSTIPEDWILAAAGDACIRDLISSRRDGFAGRIGEGGANFSGGERQRIEIARALAPKPRIVILDEATSALDPITEAEIDSHLRRRGCTCLIIAHRLSTIRDCDEIIVMERGMVAERGRHEELLALGGRYAALVGD
jgi:NHLM bacteriocin system ABC transporter peptidase/ATP-binding protein